MKKFALYTAAALLMAGALPMTAQARIRTVQPGGQDCGVSGLPLGRLTGGSCSLSGIQGVLGMNLSDLLGGSCGTEKPDCSLPQGDHMTGVIIPGNGSPDSSLPDQEQPDPDSPDSSLPDQNLPDTDLPGEDQPSQDGSQTGSYEKQVIDLVNAERAAAGLKPLSESPEASRAAALRAQEITESFSHTRPDGSGFSTALTQSGVSYRSSGENIAYGQKTPEAVMDTWMNSQGHRANILNQSYTSMGVGYYQDASGTGYWVQLFFN